MISSSEIGKIIDNPAEIQHFSIDQIKEVRDKFPYASTFHLLLLKNVALKDDLNFESELRIAAAHVLDRERLYFLIKAEDISVVTTESNNQIKTELPEKIVEAKDSLIKDNVIVEVNLPETDQDSNEIKSETRIENERETKEKSDNTSLEINAEIEGQNKVIDYKNTSTEITKDSDKKPENIVDVAPDLADIVYEISLSDELTEIEPETRTEFQLSKPTDLTEHSGSLDNHELIESNEESTKEDIQELTSDDISSLSFVQWLRYKKGLMPVSKSDEKKEVESDLDKNVVINKPLKETKKTGLSRQEIDNLLNKFIAEEPSISKPQSNFFNPVKNAKQSLQESDDLVTETLAKIYVLQKNYTKAIKAYEQLSLVYPEKKTFFASQIKKIKEQIK